MDILSFNTIAVNISKAISHKCGLNFSQTRILLYFDRKNNRPLKMGKLARELQISLSTLSRQLQQERTLELVQISRSETDSSKTVCLNEQGLSKKDELKAALTEITKDLISGLSADEIVNLETIFPKLLQKVEKA